MNFNIEVDDWQRKSVPRCYWKTNENLVIDA